MADANGKPAASIGTPALWACGAAVLVAAVVLGLGDEHVLEIEAPRRFGVFVALLAFAAGLVFRLRSVPLVLAGVCVYGTIRVGALVADPADDEAVKLRFFFFLVFVPLLMSAVALAGAGLRGGIDWLLRRFG